MLRRFTLLCCAHLFVALATFAQTPLSVLHLTCEHHANPMGMDIAHPRLSWQLSTTAQNVVQSAYSVQVATAMDFNKKSIVWASGKTASSESVLVPYTGPALKSATRYYWQVMVWDNYGNASNWSPTAWWETGLMQATDWSAQWIEPADSMPRTAPAPMLRAEFKLSGKKIASARAYITAHGVYELRINGQKAGNQELTPGWTVYSKRLQYQVYDITNQLQSGTNAIGAFVGDGWYRGSLAWGNNWGIYGKQLGLLCQLQIRYTDGTEQRIGSDASWKYFMDGPIRMAGIYEGETYDARMEPAGWDRPGFKDAAWKPVHIATFDKANIVPESGEAIRKIQEIKPVRIFKTPKGETVADFGQNMVGWVRFNLNGGVAGTRVVMHHAEVLDKQGNFYTENLRAAKCLLTYTKRGNGVESYEPRFTFMGFRYVQVEGWPGTLSANDLTGIVVHSDMQPAGTFTCSDPMLNQLQHNIVWGQKGNFLDVPTDCPQRDERLGWTGDAQVFCRTAMFNHDAAAFFTKWLRDVAADQRPNGQVPIVVPDVLSKDKEQTPSSAGWSDIATIAPWTVYQVYGDKQVLENQYPSMKLWVEYMRRAAGESLLWRDGSMFGDWLYYHPTVADFTTPDGHTDYDYISSAFFAYSTQVLSRAAAELGKTKEAAEYSDLFERIKKAFVHEYVAPSGRISANSQTAYVLALQFGLLPDDLRPAAVKILARDIRSRGNHLSTGFLGTPYLCHVLSQNDSTQVAYDLLFQKAYPSWLYPVTMGATTIWERWDGQRPDSTFQEASMNSFNHYAYGAIGDWMYRVVAGLEIAAPGYKKVLIQPHLTDRLSFANASFSSAYGQVTSGWERQGDGVVLTAVIPPNTSATIVLPTANLASIRVVAPVAGQVLPVFKVGNGKAVAEIGSGNWKIAFK